MRLIYLFRCIVLFCFGLLATQCTHTPPEEPLDLNDMIAGTYTGKFNCQSYNGINYDIWETFGNAVIEARSTDSLFLPIQDGGCLYIWESFVLTKETSFFDSLSMTSIPYSVWTGNVEQYNFIWYFPNNDSIVVSTPFHSSYGWLGKEFHGKRM